MCVETEVELGRERGRERGREWGCRNLCRPAKEENPVNADQCAECFSVKKNEVLVYVYTCKNTTESTKMTTFFCMSLPADQNSMNRLKNSHHKSRTEFEISVKYTIVHCF